MFEPVRIIKNSRETDWLALARFKRRATAVSNSIDRIKFDSNTTFETKSCYCRVARKRLPCYMAVARLGFKRRATVVSNSIHKLSIHF